MALVPMLQPPGIATRTPEDVAKTPASFTGKYLAPMLKKKK